MKKIIILTLMVSIAIAFSSCGEDQKFNDTDSQQQQQQEKLLQDQNNQVGLPDIKNWSEKKLLKKIIELRDNADLKTYLYNQNLDGKYIYIGQCIGFGIPYSTQYTNPEKFNTVDGGEYSAENPYVLPQADPNGLFSGQGQQATWIQYVNPENGTLEVIYMEPNAVVTQSKMPKRLCAEWSLPDDY